MPFTELELIAIKSITEADFYENGRQSIPWDFAVFDACPLKGKKRSGVFSSLSQKGYIHITEKPKKFIINNNGTKSRNPYWQSNTFGTISITKEGYAELDRLDLIDEDGYFK